MFSAHGVDFTLVTLNLTASLGSWQDSSVTLLSQSSFINSLERGVRYGIRELSAYRQTLVDSFSIILGSSMTILSPIL